VTPDESTPEAPGGDGVTPEERRELDAIDRALAGRAVEPDLEEIAALASELHELRAAPRPEYAAELDRRAAEWLRTDERRRARRFRLPSLRVALPAAAAAAAAAIAVAVVGGGGGGGEGEGLRLSLVQDTPAAGGAAPEAAAGGGAAPKADAAPTRDAARQRSAPPQRGAAPGGRGDADARVAVSGARFRAGERIPLRYTVLRATRARVRLGDRTGTIELPPGSGRIELATDGFDPGSYVLEVRLSPSPEQGSLRARIELL
jgi:hypothetical protein